MWYDILTQFNRKMKAQNCGLEAGSVNQTMRWEIPANHDCLKHPEFAISAWCRARAGLAAVHSPGWAVTATAEIFLLIPLQGPVPFVQRLPVTIFFQQQSWDPMFKR